MNILNKWNLTEILDCTKFNIFQSATVRNTINIWRKEKSNVIGYRKTKNIDSFKELINVPRLKIEDIELKSLNQNWGLAFMLDKSIIQLVAKIKNGTKELSKYFDVSQGYIPYRRSDLVKTFGKDKGNRIVDNREWHSDVKLSDEYLPEIFGRNLNKYGKISDETKSYVFYGPHLACYVDLRFFSLRRIVVREITTP